MKIKSSKVNNRSKAINKKIDTIYMNTKDLYCYYRIKNVTRTPNVENIEISRKRIYEQDNNVQIYDTSASNLYIEGSANFGGITIPIIPFLNRCASIEINNNEKIKNNFNKINIVRENNVILTINLENNFTRIRIEEDHDELVIITRSDNEIIKYIIKSNGKYIKYFRKYNTSTSDLDKNGNLDIRDLFKYENLSSEVMNVNTLIVDKNIFKNIDKINEFGLSQKTYYKTNIKNIRIIEDDEMKLIPFDMTFDIEKILLDKGNANYLCIKTKDDKVVIYLDKDNRLKYISRNELLKEDNIKNVYFRFRKETYMDGEELSPLSIIIKEYKDGKLTIFNLDKEIEIDDNFKKNIFINKNKLQLVLRKLINAINENDYLTLVKSKNFSDELLNKMIMINSECEIMENNAIEYGLSDKAIEYLKLRGLLEKVSELKLSEIEINTFNDLGENYTKILKK